MKHYIVLFFVSLNMFNPNYLIFSKKDVCKKQYYIQKFSWLNDSLYDMYFYKGKKYNVSLQLALSIAQTESRGKKVISQKNKNGTRDYGRFQVNAIHCLGEPKKLLKDHAKFKIIKSSSPEVLHEDRGILVNVKIKRIQNKITELENKIEQCEKKTDKVTLEMTLRKEKAKLKTLLNN